MDKYRLKLVDIVEEATGTKSYYFDKPQELDWLEGASPWESVWRPCDL